MKFDEKTRKMVHEELDKQIGVLESRSASGEMCIFDQRLIVYEDDRSRVQDPNLVDNVVTYITTEFVLMNDGSFTLEDRSIRVDRVGDVEEISGDWKSIE